LKSLVELLELLVLDCARKIGARVHRDVETLRWRSEHEGDSFITITLPTFSRDLERSLAEGGIAPGAWPSFGKTRAGIPEFLQGFLCNVFDESGHLLDEPSIDCIVAVRQICLFGKKVRRDCAEERTEDAIRRFVECDQSEPNIDASIWEVYGQVCDVLMGEAEELEAIFDNDALLMERFKPHHGPRATQEKIASNQKWVFKRWHTRLSHAGFTYCRFAAPRGTDDGNVSLREYESGVKVVEPWDEAPVRVVTVPKTLKSPRIIGVEPVCMQYIQQGIKDLVVRFLERSWMTAGHVNFTDQLLNRELARNSSRTGELATIDMSDASDRVTVAHVERLLQTKPALKKAIFACRSSRAKLPSGEVITLKKFASMGSAMCFPMEALVFFASIIAARLHAAGGRVDRRTVHQMGRSVYVYGDDLLFPSDEAPAISEGLEALGHKLNRSKSFWTGKFRESCGMDAYDGVEVTPTYLRSDCPADRTDASGLVSSVATANQLYSAGYTQCASALREAVESILGRLPQVRPDSPAIGWHHHSEVAPRRRWNQDLQLSEERHWVPVSARFSDPLSGWEALAKCSSLGIGKSVYRTMYDLPAFHRGDQHLDESVRPYSLNLKRRWVPAH
jgi:hypothetical protein